MLRPTCGMIYGGATCSFVLAVVSVYTRAGLLCGTAVE